MYIYIYIYYIYIYIHTYSDLQTCTQESNMKYQKILPCVAKTKNYNKDKKNQKI